MKNDKKLAKRLTLNTETLHVLNARDLKAAHGGADAGAAGSYGISCNEGGRCSFIYCP